MGSLSGAATANVVGTGSITIPLMIKTGFKPHVAAAFIIAEWLSIPYIETVKISIVPAILYFASVGAFIHFRSIKLDIKVEPPKIKPSQIMKDGIHFTVPVFIVIYFLAKNYTPSLAAFMGILSLIAISYVRKHSRMNIKNILQALESGGKNIVPVAAAMACVGIIIGCIGITGIGIKFSNMIVSAAGIAKASPMKTVFYGFRLAVGLFIIPLFFAYTPLLTGNVFEIVYTGFFILLGIVAFSSFAERYFLQKLSIIEMILMVSTTGLLFYPNIITNLSGILLFSGLIGVQIVRRKRQPVNVS